MEGFIPTGNCYKGERKSKVVCFNAVQTLGDSLMNSHEQRFYVKELISKARVPIVKTVHRNSGSLLDISTSNGLGVEKSKLIR